MRVHMRLPVRHDSGDVLDQAARLTILNDRSDEYRPGVVELRLEARENRGPCTSRALVSSLMQSMMPHRSGIPLVSSV